MLNSRVDNSFPERSVFATKVKQSLINRYTNRSLYHFIPREDEEKS